MTKEEILKSFAKNLVLWKKDSGHQMQSDIDLARSVYKDNKKDLIEIMNDWLLDNNKPAFQHAALRIIKDLKIYELKQNVYDLKNEILRTRKMPYLKYDLEVVDKTISVLEKEEGR
jgi:hypothetical protein